MEPTIGRIVHYRPGPTDDTARSWDWPPRV